MNGHEVRQRTFNTPELLQNILLYLPTKELYIVRRVSKQFKEAISECSPIRDKMFLNRSISPHETWKIVKGGHHGTHFQSVGHWLFMQNSQTPEGPMFRVLGPKEPRPRCTFTPAVLHPVFLNGPWGREARIEALRSAPPGWLHGIQRWVSAVMMPATFESSAVVAKGVLLDAFTSDPRCFVADVRVSHKMRSGIFHSTKDFRIQSVDGLKVKDVYAALKKLSRRLRRKAYFEGKQNLIRRELIIFMPRDIHPVTTEEWEVVKSLSK